MCGGWGGLAGGKMKPGEQVGEKKREGEKNRLPIFHTFFTAANFLKGRFKIEMKSTSVALTMRLS